MVASWRQSRYTEPMMSASAEALVQKIHDSPGRIVLAVTGGGASAIGALLEVPGASRTLLDAVVPYCERAMLDWLGARPDQFCSEPTARAMAMAAYLRACRFGRGSEGPGGMGGLTTSACETLADKLPVPPGQDTAGPAGSATHAGSATQAPLLAGVACTASLASDRPKRGDHRIHVAIQAASATMSRSVTLVKGRRRRAEEEQVAACLVLNAVAQACGVAAGLDAGLSPDEPVEQSEKIAPQPWRDLLAGRVERARHGGPASEGGGPGRVVFPGAFNPLHVGHRRMAEIAQARLGAPVEFEISILNVEKPPTDFLEIHRRVSQFAAGQTIWLTRAATFEEKSAVFPGVTFVVGLDTLRRIADPRYTGGSAAAFHPALERIARQGCRFLVFGRAHQGRFLTLDDLDLPPLLRALCQQVPAEAFHEDISSTSLRLEEH